MAQPKGYIQRCKDEANYIIANHATVRQTAKVFGISKTSIHKDMTSELPYISKSLSKEVSKVFEENFAEKHIRGGNATKKKYESLSKDKDAKEE